MTNFQKEQHKLIKRFIKKYYTYDDGSQSDYYCIWEDMHWIWVIEVWGYFRNFSDMEIALKYNITEKQLRWWYDYSLDIHTENSIIEEKNRKLKWYKKQKHITNLVSYVNGCPIHTEEEIKESEEKAKKAKDDFLKLIKEVKCSDS